MTEATNIRTWGPYTRNLFKGFKVHCDNEFHLHYTKLRQACNEIDLYPSSSQVHEMLMCAIEYGSPCKSDHVTFGEWCVLVSELQHYYAKNITSPILRSLVKVRSEASIQARRNRRVFLGGSCNPTSWRVDIAIPFFKDHGITFYNPQVQHWKPELMELEAQAKQMSDVLFFVIDSKTRAISSMIEVAYLVATKRQVVVVFCDYRENCNIEVNGEVLSDGNMAENKRRAYQCLPCFHKRNTVYIEAKYGVEGHILKQHLALDVVPHYCKLCLFRSFKRADLEAHVKTFPRHALMLKEKGIPDSEEFLVSNPNHYTIGEKDMVALSAQESANHWLSKKKERVDLMAKAVDVAFPGGIPRSPLNPTNPLVQLPSPVILQLQQLLGATTMPQPIVLLKGSGKPSIAIPGMSTSPDYSTAVGTPTPTKVPELTSSGAGPSPQAATVISPIAVASMASPTPVASAPIVDSDSGVLVNDELDYEDKDEPEVEENILHQILPPTAGPSSIPSTPKKAPVPAQTKNQSMTTSPSSNDKFINTLNEVKKAVEANTESMRQFSQLMLQMFNAVRDLSGVVAQGAEAEKVRKSDERKEKSEESRNKKPEERKEEKKSDERREKKSEERRGKEKKGYERSSSSHKRKDRDHEDRHRDDKRHRDNSYHRRY